MGWIAKNLDDTGSQSFVNDMMNVADGVITEQCNQYSSCSLYKACRRQEGDLQRGVQT